MLASGGRRVAVVGALLVGTLAGPPAGPATATAGTVAAGAVAVVHTDGGPLNARSGPSSVDAVTGQLANGARLSVVCQAYGQLITGTARTSATWLRLPDGGHVSEAYLLWQPARPAVSWCAPAPHGATAAVVRTGQAALNIRAGASAGHRLVGTLPAGSPLTVQCQVYGERVAGTPVWDVLAPGRYVSDAYVGWTPVRPRIRWCGQAPPSVPAATPAAFIAQVAEPAREGMRLHRVPASVTIAQAILESGWGRSGLSRQDHNYFGIKCFGSPGPIALGCRGYPTSECADGRCYRTEAQFRSYRSPAGSFADHGRFLVVNPRYRNAFNPGYGPDRFAVEIHRAGYATSPTYATKLIDLMRRYDLYRFNR